MELQGQLDLWDPKGIKEKEGNLDTQDQGEVMELQGQQGLWDIKGIKGKEGKLETQDQRGVMDHLGQQDLKDPKGIKGKEERKDCLEYQVFQVSMETLETKEEKAHPDTTASSKVSILEKKIDVLEKQLSSLYKVLNFVSGVKTTGDKFYAAKGNEGDYAAAKAFCEGEGGTLPTPMNKKEDLIIHQFGKAKGRNIFLGFNDKTQEGVFTYLNGKKITYSNWNPNEPNGNTRENCGEFVGSGWNDQSCNTKNIIVCEF
ncbi:pulmonary surfactant-associated protein D-like [Discoglossus pictus]